MHDIHIVIMIVVTINHFKEVFQIKKNRKNHHAGRIISLFIALCMVLSIAPITAFAANDQEITLVDFGKAHTRIYSADWKSDANSHWHEECEVCGYKKAAVEISAGASDYKIIEGANGTWTQNSDGTLVFRANGYFSKFTGVKVDGTLIDAKNYTAVSGSTVITLKADYLKTLSVGTHKLTVVYTDGECSTNFEVKKDSAVKTDNSTNPVNTSSAKSPNTGNDNSVLLLALLLAGTTGFAVTAFYGKKRKHAE